MGEFVLKLILILFNYYYCVCQNIVDSCEVLAVLGWKALSQLLRDSVGDMAGGPTNQEWASLL